MLIDINDESLEIVEIVSGSLNAPVDILINEDFYVAELILNKEIIIITGG